jgi:transcriptional regulator with XRE-family HTH domain
MTEQGSTGFGKILRDRRLRSGLTQEMLAERSGLGLRSIQGLERGETQPRRETLRRLTEAVQLPAEQVDQFETLGHPLARTTEWMPSAPTMTSASISAPSAKRATAPSALAWTLRQRQPVGGFRGRRGRQYVEQVRSMHGTATGPKRCST